MYLTLLLLSPFIMSMVSSFRTSFHRLHAQTKSLSTKVTMSNPKVFFDIDIGGCLFYNEYNSNF